MKAIWEKGGELEREERGRLFGGSLEGRIATDPGQLTVVETCSRRKGQTRRGGRGVYGHVMLNLNIVIISMIEVVQLWAYKWSQLLSNDNNDGAEGGVPFAPHKHSHLNIMSSRSSGGDGGEALRRVEGDGDREDPRLRRFASLDGLLWPQGGLDMGETAAGVNP